MVELLSVPQAARRIGASEKVVREAIHSGELAGEKVGASWVLGLDDVDAFAEELTEGDLEAEAEDTGEEDE